MAERSDSDTEVLVAGGGMVGLALGTALSEAGVATMVVDRLDPALQRDEAFEDRKSVV